MSNLGAYQDIVMAAYDAGGPEALVNAIKSAAFKAGGANMRNKLVFPLLAVGAGIGVTASIAYKKIDTWLTNKKQQALSLKKESEQAEFLLKQELANVTEDTNIKNGGTSNEQARHSSFH